MPYVSEAQRAKFQELLRQGKISQATVDEFDHASKGLTLPHRIKPATSGPIKSFPTPPWKKKK